MRNSNVSRRRLGRARRRRGSGVVGGAVACAVMVTASATIGAPVHAQGVGYRLTPGVNYVRWHEALGLEDTYLFGGQVGLTFGPAVSLQPYYFRANGVKADPATIEGTSPLAGLLARDVDVSHFGANVEINVGSGAVIPFLRGGGGVLRFEPDGGERTDQIALKAGGGLRFGLDRANVEVFAEDWGFRIDRFRLYDGVVGADPEANDYRHNLVVGAGLSIALGAGGGDVPEAAGGGAIPIEPFVGRLEYDDALDLGRQNVGGVRAGIDVNSYVGVRGFYWRGVNDDFDAVEDVTSYGGEAQFALNQGTGLVPYLVAGAGRFDYEDGFTNRSGGARADITTLILGAGVGFQLGQHLRLNVAARDYLLNASTELEDLSRTDDLVSNWMYTAGVTFRLGGSAPGQGAVRPAAAPASPQVARLQDETERLRQELARTRAEVRPEPGSEQDERLRAIERSLDDLRAAERPPGSAVTAEDLARMERRIADRMDEVMARRAAAVPQRSEPIIVVPGAVPAGSAAPSVDMAALERRLSDMEDRIAQRIEAVERRMRDELERREAAQPADRFVVIGEDTALVVQEQQRFQWRPQEFRPYLGLNFDDPTQLVLGTRVDLGGVTPGSQFRLLPEIALGFGESGRTVLVAANLLYSFGTLGGRTQVTPYAMVGAGVFTESVLSLNLAYGATIDVDVLGATRNLFVEHQGLNLFDRNRLLLGLRFER